MSRDNGRLKVGLALGGGVARGLAHIGVLSELERAGVTVDCVAGTSIGALIGASWCAGLSVDELRDIAARTGWWQVSRPFVSGGGFMTFMRLEKWIIDNLGDFHVDDLAVPFAAVASDLVTGERVVLRDGRLTTAVRASCSVPGFVPPVELEGRVLVDGGITDNIPADVARLLGADYVIGVDIFMPALRPRLGPLSKGLAAIETLVRHAGMGSDECDCLIVPELRGESYFRFSEYARFITLGEEATRRALPEILDALQRAEAAPREPQTITPPQFGTIHSRN